jgi:hypothetical protein
VRGKKEASARGKGCLDLGGLQAYSHGLGRGRLFCSSSDWLCCDAKAGVNSMIKSRFWLSMKGLYPMSDTLLASRDPLRGSLAVFERNPSSAAPGGEGHRSERSQGEGFEIQ